MTVFTGSYNHTIHSLINHVIILIFLAGGGTLLVIFQVVPVEKSYFVFNTKDIRKYLFLEVWLEIFVDLLSNSRISH